MRNRYLDVLRSLAITRVVLYHATGWPLLTVVFPAMGTMFAVGGSLMASSLDRGGTRVVVGRVRRLLPPLWTIALLAVPAMIVTGMTADVRLLFWVLPLHDPPLYGWGTSVLGVVWYLRQYLWFVLLSPVALPLFRRFPLPSVVAPFALLAVIELWLPALGALRDFGIYLGCWLLGFAHHDGMLAKLRRGRLLAIAGGLGVAGMAWLLTHPGRRGLDLNDIPIAHALWSAAFVLVLLGLAVAPKAVDWVDRWQVGAWLVTALNRRAVTIYLWHLPVVVGLSTLVGLEHVNLETPYGRVIWLGAVAAAVAGCAIAFGWVEDLAARRRPSLVPGRRPASRTALAEPAATR